MLRVHRGGPYSRVCLPEWADPSDTSYSKRAGGRWNPPGEFGALYLNANVEVAKANARRLITSLFGETISILDLEDHARPELQHYDIAPSEFVDVVTADGIAAANLPPNFPDNAPHAACYAIARLAYATNDLAGIAPFSAVMPTEEELVIFDRCIDMATKGSRDLFATWFLGGHTP